MSTLFASGQHRYIAGAGVTGTAGSDYQVASSKRYTPAALAAFTVPVFSLGPDYGTRYRGVEIGFLASAASQTVSYRLYQVKRGIYDTKTDGTGTADYELHLLGYGTFTSGTVAGVAAAAVIGTAEYWADTITWTLATSGTSPVGIGASVVSAYSAATPLVWSPGSNVPGRLFVPDCGGALGVLLDFDPGNTIVANAYLEAIT